MLRVVTNRARTHDLQRVGPTFSPPGQGGKMETDWQAREDRLVALAPGKGPEGSQYRASPEQKGRLSKQAIPEGQMGSNQASPEGQIGNLPRRTDWRQTIAQKRQDKQAQKVSLAQQADQQGRLVANKQAQKDRLAQQGSPEAQIKRPQQAQKGQIDSPEGQIGAK